ncbi:hypothetical protein [Niveibacterium sp. SC-1]|uniref:hypothetical protein n=1 Tax=Niveibacterium sp. SC-1 TaxID=3135646 RepID=UPI00311F020F
MDPIGSINASNTTVFALNSVGSATAAANGGTSTQATGTPAEDPIQTFFSQFARSLLEQEIASGPLDGLLANRNSPWSGGSPLYGATGILNLASSLYLSQLANRTADPGGTNVNGLTGFGSNALDASRNAIQGFLQAYTTVSLLGSLPELPTTALLPFGNTNTTGTNGFDFGAGTAGGNTGTANASANNAATIVEQNINIFA